MDKKNPPHALGKPPLALIAGPTASGKSKLAVDLALALERRGKKAAVINADSAQVYADLNVLSARPEEAEMRGIPHRLFGTWDGANACSAADWAKAAREEIDALHEGGAVPILCGGTGLYIQILLQGIAQIPPIARAVREEVRALAGEEAYRALEREDPERAGHLAPGDSQRIARALEVVRATGKPLGEWQNARSGGIGERVRLFPLILMAEREWLYPRCDARFEAMLDAGAIAEVEKLLARDLPEHLPVMRAIGVGEIAAFLRGEIAREEMIARAQQATRNYAKRQFTWLRRQPPGDWPRVSPQNYDMEAIFASLLLN